MYWFWMDMLFIELQQVGLCVLLFCFHLSAFQTKWGVRIPSPHLAVDALVPSASPFLQLGFVLCLCLPVPRSGLAFAGSFLFAIFEWPKVSCLRFLLPFSQELVSLFCVLRQLWSMFRMWAVLIDTLYRWKHLKRMLDWSRYAFVVLKHLHLALVSKEV